MKREVILVMSAIALAVAGQVAAQTCASPLPITSEGGPNDVVTADTCAASNELPAMGAFSNPQNDVIYSYVSQGASASIALTSDEPAAAAYLLPSCDTSTDPIALAYAGVPMVVNSTLSPDGATMYINMTVDGTSPPTTCGNTTLTVTGTLPVELNSFSID